jgi:hypothetical protein
MLLGHIHEKIQCFILKVIDIQNAINALACLALGALDNPIFCQIIFVAHRALREGGRVLKPMSNGE